MPRPRKRDGYSAKAKREGYRSRAAYKLLQINSRFYLIRGGYAVVDLGAAPGGWSQVAASLVGEDGVVIAVDVLHMRPLPGVRFIRGDVRDEKTLLAVVEALGEEGREYADVVISDMAPNTSGVYSLDHARSIDLAEAALRFASEILRPGGNFVCKVFQGDMMPHLLRRVRRSFRMVKVHVPPATRKGSAEQYVVAKGFRGRQV